MHLGWVIWIHVLSAIIGVGPTYAMPLFVRKGQTRQQMNVSLQTLARLETFPKIGGPLAVLSGIALVVFSDYGSFLQVWQIGSLLLFIVIQVIVIGFVAPRTKKLHAALAHGPTAGVADAAPAAGTEGSLAADQEALAGRIRRLLLVTMLLSIALFSFMILKP